MGTSLEHNIAEKDRIMSQLQFLDETRSGIKGVINRNKGYNPPMSGTMGASPPRNKPVKLGGLIDNKSQS